MNVVSEFLTQSYEAAFGSQDIPWAEVAREPGKYYDTVQFPLGFPSSGLAELSRDGWYDLAETLSSVAGPGTSGFFCKVLGPSPAPDDGLAPSLPPGGEVVPPRPSCSPSLGLPPRPSHSPSPPPPVSSRSPSPAVPQGGPKNWGRKRRAQDDDATPAPPQGEEAPKKRARKTPPLEML
ncbi:hypothetical protein DFH07DRAFT_438926 [Mycena maculata]|uniref:Uncharacterized protein n=1 Tax=Mycena maculata TaxID=230809 RepID=A0AAD7K8P8_9AGAR|nr:hypothetical protein DFH07DRAFT_438926 [Mycena maculata]